LDIDDVPKKTRICYSISKDADTKIEFGVLGKTLDSARIPVVLLRHFNLRSINFNTEDVANVFSLDQWDEAIRSLQSKLKCEWINAPESTIHAGDHVQQLSIAKVLGFRIPSTLITNDPKSARQFYHAHHENILLKMIHHHTIEVKNKVFFIYSHVVREQDLVIFDDLIHAPSILQERIDKKSDLRVTVVGERVFGVELDSQSDVKGRHDINRCQLSKLIKKPIKLDKTMRKKCVKLIKHLGLKYGAIDFVMDKMANPYFLEVNPIGDWLWIEHQTGLRITEAMVDLIEGFYRNSNKLRKIEFENTIGKSKVYK
jgi:glutathione synthase/RimK-type ligase-like ATP-grasp enzyme